MATDIEIRQTDDGQILVEVMSRDKQGMRKGTETLEVFEDGCRVRLTGEAVESEEEYVRNGMSIVGDVSVEVEDL